MAFGSAAYFTLSFEPNIAYPLSISAIAAAILLFRKPGILLATILLFIFGFCYAVGFTRWLNTPQIKHTLRNHEITGKVTNIDYTNDKARVFIKSNIGLVRATTTSDAPKIGDTVSARVTVFKPDGPSAPGTFDYARWTYFNGITATGYINEITVTDRGKAGNINTFRDYIHSKTNSFLSDTLVLGYKSAVPKDDTPIWTATGVGHVWSISGFHMTIVGGWLFAFFYLAFRLIAPLTKRIPARFPAIICAWLGLLFYLFLSGIDVATIRAFLMTSLAFGAILLGRNALSMRFTCLAFIAIYLLNPHYAMQPGFQLSFAAIFGLIWYFEGREYKKSTLFGKAINIVKYAAITSVIATAFTAPFVAAHFYSMPLYGLLGNLFLLPVFSFIIMPLVLFGTVTALFGFFGPLIFSATIYDWTLTAAHRISELPFATIQIPHVSNMALAMMLVGFLCLMFINYRRVNYILFVLFITVGITTAALAPRPIFYTTYDNELVGFVRDGKLEFNKARASNHYFAFDSWKQLNFEKTGTKNIRRKCAGGVCKFGDMVYIQKYVPLSRNIAELCRSNDTKYIVSYFKIDAPNCNARILHGGFVMYKSGKVVFTPHGRWWHTVH